MSGGSIKGGNFFTSWYNIGFLTTPLLSVFCFSSYTFAQHFPCGDVWNNLWPRTGIHGNAILQSCPIIYVVHYILCRWQQRPTLRLSAYIQLKIYLFPFICEISSIQLLIISGLCDCLLKSCIFNRGVVLVYRNSNKHALHLSSRPYGPQLFEIQFWTRNNLNNC